MRNFILLLSLLLLISCANTQRELLEKADHASIDSIEYYYSQIQSPHHFSELELAQYNFIGALLVERSNGKLPYQALVQTARIFDKHNDTTHWNGTTLLILESYLKRMKYDSLLLFCNTIEQYKIADSNFIRYTLLYQAKSHLALNDSNRGLTYANDFIHQSTILKDSANIIKGYNLLGEYYKKKKNLKLSLFYYTEALNYLQAHNLSWLQVNNMYSNLINTCLLNKDTLKAISFSNNMHNAITDRRSYPLYLLIRGHIFYDIQQIDSAFYYYNQALTSSSPYIAQQAHAKLNELTYLYSSPSVNYYQNRNSHINDYEIERQIKHLIEINEFDKLKLKNQLNLLQIKKSNQTITLLTSILIVLILAAIIFYYYQNEKRLRLNAAIVHEQELKEKESNILKMENNILRQENEISAMHMQEMQQKQKVLELRESLFRYLPFLNRLTELHDTSNNHSQKIEISDKEWNEIIFMVDHAFERFTERLHTHYNLLNEKDLRFCSLVKINISNKDLSNIYCVTESAIIKRKYRIKTEKLGITDPEKGLDEVLREF